VIGTDGFLNSRSEQLATLAIRHAMPAIFQYREFLDVPPTLLSRADEVIE
jgi:hypothetical protein